MSDLTNDEQCCEVPLIEQLRSIPADYRTCRAIQWASDGTETGHQFIPVGYMMHRSADRISQLEAENAAMAAELAEAVAALKAGCQIIEVGDERLLAQDGPCGNQPPDLTLAERRILYVTLHKVLAKHERARVEGKP